MITHNNILLSICIPTWNRANFLDFSLKRLSQQVNDIKLSYLEIFISDNASDDNTQEIVEKYINKELPITYNRNENNVGPDQNFIRCMEMANGKYIWLLGDDDFIKPNALKKIIDILKKEDLGLLHLCAIAPNHNLEKVVVCDNISEYITYVSYYSTFMSGNIFNRSALTTVGKPNRYLKSFLVQMPFFIDAMLTHKINAYIGINTILEAGADGSNNGGYNFFEVFVKNYLTIWKERLDEHGMPRSIYNSIKEHIFRNFTYDYIMMLLVFKRNVATHKNENGRKGWNTDKGWLILLRYYGCTKYFHQMLDQQLLHIYGYRLLCKIGIRK